MRLGKRLAESVIERDYPSKGGTHPTTKEGQTTRRENKKVIRGRWPIIK